MSELESVLFLMLILTYFNIMIWLNTDETKRKFREIIKKIVRGDGDAR